ncbi:MAG: hypothetical protein WDZ91_12540 [Paenibacillaceae bacterium]
MAVRELTQTILAKKSGWSSEIYKKIARHWQLYILIAFPTAFLITFNYIPMLGVQIAFKNYSFVKGFWKSPWAGMEYFNSFFSSPYFWPVVKNTLRISIYTLLVATPMPIFLALCLNEVKHERYKRFVQMFTYKTYLLQNSLNLGTSEIIATYVYKIGLLNANYSFAVAVGLFNSFIGFILVLSMNFIAGKVSDTSLF